MALTYFLDVDGDPVAAADSYAEFDKIDILLEWSPLWRSLDTTRKERMVKMATQHLDAAFHYSGERISDDTAEQTLEFPRDFGVTDEPGVTNHFSIAEQKRRLLSSVRHIIDKSLTRLGANISEYQGDGELIRQLQEHTPREVLQLMAPYVAK